ncbi:phytoene desaturase family protein [Roseivirga sp. UBA1976]|uniref:phytoene desaturase family protein n=1 Tax=Roseivirga sp. UBA1976 TaxID=1947386 RepID=UPI00257D150B|nr:phytoene desaturase family protein [Roseivirga sp. UBA1976]|tara:strand:- start:5383 stop:6858 length:1476 start_codon:yes stop_codon:yes gene_type:complete
MNRKKALVIGSGFAGLSAAINLADKGFNVTILEKNNSIGGRARQFTESGFTFDMGPSWYWMPDVFESFFNRFGKSVSDYYELIRLDPSYQVIYEGGQAMPIPAKMDTLKKLFDSLEEGAGGRLEAFLRQAAYKYEVGINQLVYKPGRSLKEFASLKLLFDVVRMDVFQSMARHVRKYFKHPKLVQLMEFPVLFLGALPQNTPALYSLMNYADMALGTWYPKGGMYKIVEALGSLASELGVEIKTDHEVTSIVSHGQKITHVETNKGNFQADVVVAGADYHHVDTQLLNDSTRNYSDRYWDKRVLAPSSLLYYVGLDKKLEGLLHHNLFFDTDFAPHAHHIYTNPQWPEKPLFYASVTSKTDETVAPEGCENLFLLIPVAPGLQDTDTIREHYFELILKRMEDYCGQTLAEHIVYKRSFAHTDFVNDYHSFKGNAYGLANTLRQTAILKPALKNKHLKNLYYTGQLTVPGPGVPPSLISGIVVANEVAKDFS